MMIETIKNLSDKYFQQVIEYRRYLHQYPELSGREKNTAEYITLILDKLQIPYKKNIAGYGIVALLRGEFSLAESCVALRADMDALPVQEETNKIYSSKNQEIMHACGHDVHLASLLGTLHILSDLKAEFSGTIKAIFQPSEEQYDGGADFMIEAGVLHEPEVKSIFSQHVTPELPVGTIGVREGNFMASTDEIYFKIKGKGGHAAIPEETVNPIYIGIDIIQTLQKYIIENKLNVLLNFGRFTVNGLTNRVSEEGEIAGTLRCFDEKERQEMKEIIRQIATNQATSLKGSCEVLIKNGYPVLVNDIAVTQRLKKYACDYLSKENVRELPKRNTAEDFAYFLREKPGCFYRLGTGRKEAKNYVPLHSSQFDIDEQALKIGMGLMAWIVLNEIKI